MTSSTSARSPLAPHVQAFFTEHLCHHKRVRPQTIASCRATFRLLLTFVKETVGVDPSALREADLATQERALQKLAPLETPLARFIPADPLLAFLTSL